MRKNINKQILETGLYWKEKSVKLEAELKKNSDELYKQIQIMEKWILKSAETEFQLRASRAEVKALSLKLQRNFSPPPTGE